MIDRTKQILNKSLSAACAILLAFMSMLTCYQVFMRYVIRRPSTMSEDILSYSFVWLSLLATALVFGERDHMNLTFFVDKMGSGMRKGMAVFSEFLVLAVSLLVFVFGGKGFMDVGAIQVSPTLNITMDIIYSILPISGVLICLYSMINIVEIIRDKDLGQGDKEEGTEEGKE
ncbi:TRAP transporter small permease [Lachnospiraceae bacterium 62-35]